MISRIRKGTRKNKGLFTDYVLYFEHAEGSMFLEVGETKVKVSLTKFVQDSNTQHNCQ